MITIAIQTQKEKGQKKTDKVLGFNGEPSRVVYDELAESMILICAQEFLGAKLRNILLGM